MAVIPPLVTPSAVSTLPEETERLFEVALIAPRRPSKLDEEFEMYLLEV